MTKGKKKRLAFGIIIFLLAGTLAIYWFYFSPPSPLPGNEQMVKEINELLPEADADEIQETIRIDDKHAVAPFKSKEGRYSVSNWVWKQREWKLGKVRTAGEPKIWKIYPDDPATYRIVWNIDPAEDRVDTLNYFFIRERYYSISGTKHHYDPSIQMKKEVSFQENPYGVMKLPEDWIAVMEAMAEELGQGSSFIDDFNPQPYLSFGWIPLDENGEDFFPESAVNGSSFQNGNIPEEHMRLLNVGEVE
ncbi:hypothetical protein [Bacillus sp. Marseille-Q1617]|uniref:hypothetical protein n=1 Tax=Bacillus sp. Marseille-Q1617 TaxID=2736887 RepID=UPI00158F0436|nr:hypothetical protein [Bacillus sp. Marseille-Q1617]